MRIIYPPYTVDNNLILRFVIFAHVLLLVVISCGLYVHTDILIVLTYDPDDCTYVEP